MPDDSRGTPTYEQLYAWLIEAESHVALLEAALARIGGAVGTTASAGYVRHGFKFGSGVGDEFEPPSL